jgi:hypothetical protein
VKNIILVGDTHFAGSSPALLERATIVHGGDQVHGAIHKPAKHRRHGSPKGSTTKCVQVVGQGMPVRLSNADAYRLVAIDHDAEYCPRSVWRKHQAYVAEHAPDSAKWPFSAPRYKLTDEGRLVPYAA